MCICEISSKTTVILSLVKSIEDLVSSLCSHFNYFYYIENFGLSYSIANLVIVFYLFCSVFIS